MGSREERIIVLNFANKMLARVEGAISIISSDKNKGWNWLGAGIGEELSSEKITLSGP